MINLQQKDGTTSIPGLKKNAWKVQRQATLDYLKKLQESMPRRMEAVIHVQEGHTDLPELTFFLCMIGK